MMADSEAERERERERNSEAERERETEKPLTAGKCVEPHSPEVITYETTLTLICDCLRLQTIK
jgi:hypothetical protein